MTRKADFVFIHGGTQAGWVWDEAIAALREIGGDAVGRCIALDIAGCGAKRDRDTSAMDFAETIADVIADIDAAGLNDAVLVGHSQAGTVIPRVLQACGDRFRQVIYVSCIAPENGLNIIEAVGKNRMKDGDFESQGMGPDLIRNMFCNDMDEAATAAFFAKLGRDNWPVSSYTQNTWTYDDIGAVPASYIVCLQDNSIDPAEQRASAKRFEAQRIREIDCGHQAMNTQPEALARLLLEEAGQAATAAAG